MCRTVLGCNPSVPRLDRYSCLSSFVTQYSASVVRRKTSPSLKAGATMHSTKSCAIASAASSSTGTVKAITDPKALTGSQASAFSYASRAERPTASPHGVVCLMIAQHASAPNGYVLLPGGSAAAGHRAIESSCGEIRTATG